jgi:regulatory protein
VASPGASADGEPEDGTGADREPVGEDVVKDICLRLLTDRARTRAELTQALRRRNVPDEVSHRVLDRFNEVGLIDDQAFAAQWVCSRHRYRGLGRRAIAVELRRKGVSQETANEALAEVGPESERQRAVELVRQRLRALPVAVPEDRVKAARKLVGMLARKGYSPSIAYEVVRTELAARGAEEDELGTAEFD